MLKRLGMWNRLALVLTIAALVIMPFAAVQKYISDAYESRQLSFKLCREMNAGTGKGDFKAWLERDERCLQELVAPVHRPDSSYYWEMLLTTAIVCVIVYSGIWAVVGIGKWIWRGRTAGQS